MKIRNPLLISICAFVAAWLFRLWMMTVRYRQRASSGPDYSPCMADLPGNFIFSVWHEDIPITVYHYARSNMHALISRHADGQFVADVAHRLGMKVIFGSTTRGGTEALLQMLKVAEKSHLAITPDGPRGPRRRVQAGMIYVAARTGLPIVVGGFAYANAWRAGSWDRMALPKPFSKVLCVTMPPILVPDTEDREVLEDYRRQVENALLRARQLAEEQMVSRRAGPVKAPMPTDALTEPARPA